MRWQCQEAAQKSPGDKSKQDSETDEQLPAAILKEEKLSRCQLLVERGRGRPTGGAGGGGGGRGRGGHLKQ